MTISQLVKWPFYFFDLKSSLQLHKWRLFPVSIGVGTYTQKSAVASEVNN